MAEVLITLGIIGVVAALTMPVLTANYRKKNVVTHLKKFTSTMNQAIKLAEVENGNVSEWDAIEKLNGDSMYNMWNKYIQKQFTDAKVEIQTDGITVNLPDGAAMNIYNPRNNGIGFSYAHVYYCMNQKYCSKLIEDNDNKIAGAPLDGKNTFLFLYDDKKFGPYFYAEEGKEKNKEYLLERPSYGCNQSHKYYCAALIEYENWEIPDYYPVKF